MPLLCLLGLLGLLLLLMMRPGGVIPLLLRLEELAVIDESIRVEIVLSQNRIDHMLQFHLTRQGRRLLPGLLRTRVLDMEMRDRLDQFHAVESAVLVEVVHVEIVELQLLRGHIRRGIHFPVEMLLDVLRILRVLPAELLRGLCILLLRGWRLLLLLLVMNWRGLLAVLTRE